MKKYIFRLSHELNKTLKPLPEGSNFCFNQFQPTFLTVTITFAPIEENGASRSMMLNG